MLIEFVESSRVQRRSCWLVGIRREGGRGGEVGLVYIQHVGEVGRFVGGLETMLFFCNEREQGLWSVVI